MAELRVLSRTDFSGGINASASPYQLGATQVLRLENLLLDEQGSLYVRDGSQTIDTAPPGTTGVLSLYDLVQTGDVLTTLAIVRSATGQTLHRRGAAQPWPLLGTFATSYDIPTLNTFANRVIIAAGYEPIKYYDGTTFGSLTAGPTGEVLPAGAKHIAVHKGFLWVWNTAAATTATEGPSALRCSGFDNPNRWPVENSIFLSNDDGQQGQGLATFALAETGISPQGVLVAFKDFSTYTVNSVFGAPEFTVEKVKTDLGCVAPRSIQFISGLGIVRLTHRGFAVFDGTNDTVISEAIRPYLFQQTPPTELTPIAWEHIGRATATQAQNPPYYLCACALGPGPGLNRLFIFDIQRKAWTVCSFPTAFATVDAQFDPGVQPYVLAGEQGGPRVQRLFEGDPRDDGQAIAWSVRIAPLRGQGVTQRLYVRRGLLHVAHMVAGQSITWRDALGPARQLQVPPARRTASSLTTPLAIEAALPFDVGRTGGPYYYEFSGEGQLVIRGLDLHVRPKPPSRPMRI